MACSGKQRGKIKKEKYQHETSFSIYPAVPLVKAVATILNNTLEHTYTQSHGSRKD